jgi:predicted nucleic acid-binding protein
MRLVDSSAWIEYLSGSALGLALKMQFPGQDDWIVPTLVQMELTKWLVRENLGDTANEVISFSGHCVVVPLDTATALLAADVGAQYRLSTADSIIYATALAYDADLLTCDRHFEGLPGVVYVAKPIAP